ncbi:MAG TPA: Spy/CpxP family protein refolding chaperone [Phycisphaerae bacterium]|nr:Spy/CpxP family protein refolding chaperone [Phycisphaerae bacterium]
MNRLSMLVLMGVGLVTATALAQEEGAARARRGLRGVGDVEQAVTLTQEQKQKVGELQEKLRTEMREQWSGRQRDEAAIEKWRQLRQQVLEAAKAGDDAKVEALQKELNETDRMAQRRKLASNYYDEVAKILTPDQKKPFEVWRKLQDSGVPANLLADPEAMKAALKTVDLSDAQKKEIDAAFAQHEAQTKALKAEDAPAKQAADQALAMAVAGQLKPSQKVLLTEAEREKRRHSQGSQGPPSSGQAH